MDTRSALLETVRLYALIPALPRYVANGFEFGGHYIPSGTTVMWAMSVSHLLEEHFPNPTHFDIDRYSRDKGYGSGVFAPFGLGPHSCLGQGFAQLLMAVGAATMLHHMDFELASPDPDKKLKMTHHTTARPDDNFKVRISPRNQHAGAKPAYAATPGA